jgi:hypothetical protein
VITGYVLAFLLQRYWVPEFLQNAVSLMLVVAAFTVANEVQPEAGLLASTVMGIVLANQKLADVRHIVEFKENLRVLLLAGLFIVLAARLQPADLTRVGWSGLLFVLVLVFVARPLAVWASALGSRLAWNERIFVAWMAPRGIVAAAVSSLFAIRLEYAGHADAHLLVPITFLAIIGTVVIYGVTTPIVARRLGVAMARPQGILFVGAQAWSRAVAQALRERGVPVLLVDNNRYQIAAARQDNLPTYHGSILADYVLDELSLGGLGRLLAVTSNDWVNALAVQRFTRIFGSAECYQLPPRSDPVGQSSQHRRLHGRWLFGEAWTYPELTRRFGDGWLIWSTPLTTEFALEDYRRVHGESAIPMFVVSDRGRVNVLVAGQPLVAGAGQTIISLVPPPATRRSG